MFKRSWSARKARFPVLLLTALAFAASSGFVARAEVKTVVECRKAYHATPAFRFKHVPSPSADDAATKAEFTIVAGQADPNCGGLAKLNDGKLPRDGDDRAENFFFGAGTPGGRLAVDLHRVLRIKQVNTYSWHAGTRGAQVYKLYAGDGTAAGFSRAPKSGTDLAKHGWKLIASVDTRPAGGYLDGQYGVSISDSDGALGKYRYLLFDIACTENKDPFGNTFYSEIDVIDAAAPAPPVAVAPSPAAKGPVKYEIAIDYSETPEFKEWVETKLRPTLEKWYPILVASLPGEEFVAPRRLTVTFKKQMKGVAYTTAGARIFCAGPWFKANLDGEAQGAVVHELVHVVQQIQNRNSPRWLIEGSADYFRWFKYEPKAKRPRPNPRRAKVTDGYRTTAAFLNYLSEKYDQQIVARLNAAMREATYTDELFKELTGKGLDELWQEYVATLEPAKE